jgi:hypothetical protein
MLEWARYLSTHGVVYSPPRGWKQSGLSLLILPELVGKPWDNIALSALSAFNPPVIRVTFGEIKTDWWYGRITVYITKPRRITAIMQECLVDLENGDGRDLRLYLERPPT